MSNTKNMVRKVTALDGLESDLNLLDMTFAVNDETKAPEIDSVTVVINSSRGSFSTTLDNDSGDEVDLHTLYLFLYSDIENKINHVNSQLNQLLEERLNPKNKGVNKG